MDFALIYLIPLAASAALGFALNRFLLKRIRDVRLRVLATAASRAVFYAPAVEHFGHGVHLPVPLLLVLAYAPREFGPELGLLTFLLPFVVFLASLAIALSRRFGWWFSGLVGAHLALLGVLPFMLSSYETRLSLFSVNALPWYPLQHLLGLRVVDYDRLRLPTELGWVWCVAAWLVIYAMLALAIERLTLRSTGRGKNAAPVS